MPCVLRLGAVRILQNIGRMEVHAVGRQEITVGARVGRPIRLENVPGHLVQVESGGEEIVSKPGAKGVAFVTTKRALGRRAGLSAELVTADAGKWMPAEKFDAILIDAPCEAELVEVMTRKFARKTLDAQAQAAALAHCRRLTTRVDAQLSMPERARLPLCRDPDDQKFLELAFAAGADILITKDKALLDLYRRKKKQVGRTVSFKILTPEDFEEN